MNRPYQFLRELLTDLLRIPPHPHPPLGSPNSLRQFQAGAAYDRLRMTLWGLRQVSLVVGLIVSAIVVHALLPDDFPVHYKDGHNMKEVVIPVRQILWFVEPAALFFALIQLPFSWAVIRLEYDFRCYMVTDRSLRIRDGLTTVRETTLSFANVQQIRVEQGPVQRFLGLADVVVTSAGGGASPVSAPGQAKSDGAAHTARFRDVDNAEEIRHLIVERLRMVKDAGLGDRDDQHPAATMPPIPVSTAGDSLEAARQVLAECRLLRRILCAE